MKNLMAANWKMYKTRDEAGAEARDLYARVAGELPEDREVLIVPPFTAIEPVTGAIGGKPGFFVGGQNLYPAEEGAFTGEISAAMLKDAGATHALAGHSERRHVLGETDDLVGLKTAFGLNHGLSMILCVGEKIEERKAGRVAEVIDRQLEKGLADVDPSVASERIIVAYEPVWAIGTGEVAGPEEIVEAHAVVRKKLFGLLPAIANEIRILYGGSVKPDNTKDIMALDNVNGVLVGGASLRAESFSRIVLA